MNVWRRPRRTTMVLKAMLLVWLFSMAAGWANACVLQARADAHGRGPAHESSGVLHQQTPVPSLAAPHDDSDGALQACLSFCDREQGTIPKQKLPVLADLDPSLPAAIGAWVPWSLTPPAVQPLALATHPPPGPAVAIRFLRLNL